MLLNTTIPSHSITLPVEADLPKIEEIKYFLKRFVLCFLEHVSKNPWRNLAC